MSKILIIDDEEINLQLISNILKSDYSVFVASHADDAMSCAIQEQPDLILLDIIMPGKNGFDLCKQIKNNIQTINIPIIFLTSKSNEKDQAEGFKLGAVDYIIKPFRPLIDLQRIAVHIKLNRQYRSNLYQSNLAYSSVSTKNNLEKKSIQNELSNNFFGLEKEIKALYRLTDAEASLCSGLINGLALEDIATNMGVTYSTLRGYLKHIFVKTGTKKQHELVSTIMTALLLWDKEVLQVPNTASDKT